MTTKNKNKWYTPVVVLLLAPIWLPIGVAIFMLFLIVSVLIYFSVWLFWNTRGINLLYVYSNSPNWKAHIEDDILPKLPEGKIVLNWSERKQWKRLNLSSLVFWHFSGYRAFNPLAVVLRPFRRAKVFRFYEAFKDYKHGKTDPLTKMESNLFEALRK